MLKGHRYRADYLCELVERLIYEKGLHEYKDWEDLQDEITRKSKNVPDDPTNDIEEDLKDKMDESFRESLNAKL